MTHNYAMKTTNVTPILLFSWIRKLSLSCLTQIGITTMKKSHIRNTQTTTHEADIKPISSASATSTSSHNVHQLPHTTPLHPIPSPPLTWWSSQRRSSRGRLQSLSHSATSLRRCRLRSRSWTLSSTSRRRSASQRWRISSCTDDSGSSSLWNGTGQRLQVRGHGSEVTGQKRHVAGHIRDQPIIQRSQWSKVLGYISEVIYTLQPDLHDIICHKSQVTGPISHGMEVIGQRSVVKVTRGHMHRL